MPVIPAWVMRLLPYVLLVAALLAAVWYIDHRGYKRAEAAAELRATKERQKAEADRREREQLLIAVVSQIDRKVADRLSRIAATETKIQPIIREVRNEARYTDPACSLGDGVFDALNQARAASNTPLAEPDQ